MRKRVYQKPFLLFHWAPVERRASISRRGLLINSKPVQHSQEFPHTCFSDSPSLAWALSARCMNVGGEFDLWMCWSNSGRDYLPIGRRDDLGKYPTEYRVYEDILPGELWRVGSRVHTPRKRRVAEKVHGGKVKL